MANGPSAGWRKGPDWYPALAQTTAEEAGALTVAGQWRNYTAFPSIQAIAVVNSIARLASNHRVIKQPLTTSTFIKAGPFSSQKSRELMSDGVGREKLVVTPG